MLFGWVRLRGRVSCQKETQMLSWSLALLCFDGPRRIIDQGNKHYE
jgi:hypothetical protein